MKHLLFAGLVVGLPFGQAYAVEDKELAKCAVTSGDLSRLECYDQLAREYGLDGPQPEPTEVSGDTGSWVVRRDVNPIDDSERVLLRLAAEEGSSRWGETIFFIARCSSETTEAYIAWNDYLGTDGNYRSNTKSVTIRIGDEPARTEDWDVSTDKEATFAPNWAGSLLKEMTQSNRFIAQTTPYNESPITAVFDTNGLAIALEPLMAACGWSL